MLSRAQAIVGLGMLAAVVAIVTAVWAIPPWLAPIEAASAGDRLALAARWMLVPALCLAAGVGFVSAWRFGRRDALGEASTGANLALRYNLNTLEQAFLAGVAWAGLALSLRPEQLTLIPVLAGLFGVGRLTFAIGYAIAPPFRAFGMGLTAYPTYAALAWLAVQALR